jgi:hypothetical protein
MKWPLQREAHARQDKVQNPDYREELALEGDNFDRGGKERPKMLSRIFFRGKNAWIRINVNSPDFKTDDQKFLEHILRREMMFKVSGYMAKLEWGRKKFRQHNNLQGKPDEGVYQEIRNSLEELYAITIKQFRRAERDDGGTEVVRDGREKICYRFKSGLVPANTVKLENEKVVFDIDFINVPQK